MLIPKINRAVDVEELQFQLEKELCEVSPDTWIKLAVFFKLEQGTYQAKSKFSVARLLRRHIETLDYPIIGNNVIEELVKNNKVLDQIAGDWAVSFPSVCYEKIQSLVNFMQAPSLEQLCSVKTIKKDVVIPSKTTLELLIIPSESFCRIQINVSNTSNHDIRLTKRTVLGTLQLVKSVTPQEVRLKDDVDRCETHVNSVHTKPKDGRTTSTIQEEMQASETSFTQNENDHNPIDDLDLTSLTTKQWIKIQTILEEE